MKNEKTLERLDNLVSLIIKMNLEVPTCAHAYNMGYSIYRDSKTGNYLVQYKRELSKSVSTDVTIALQKLITIFSLSDIKLDYEISAYIDNHSQKGYGVHVATENFR